MPFPIQDPRLTQPMVTAYALKGKTPFQLDEVVVPVSIVQNLDDSPYATVPKRFAALNNMSAVAGRHCVLEVRLLADNILAEITEVRVSAANQPLILSMAGTTTVALSTFVGQAIGVDLAPLGPGSGGNPLTGEVSLAAVHVGVGILGARFANIANPLNIDHTVRFENSIVLRPGGPRLWILATVVNTSIPLATVFGRLWGARG